MRFPVSLTDTAVLSRSRPPFFCFDDPCTVFWHGGFRREPLCNENYFDKIRQGLACQKKPSPGSGDKRLCVCTVPKVPLTPTQENELLDFMQNDPVYVKYYDEVVILLETGLRISELCGLTPADLNFEKRFVNVDHQLLRSTEDGYYIEAPKTESGFRQVPMSAAAYEAFERVLKKRRDGRCIEVDGYKDFLFLNRDGLPKTAVNYDAMFKCLAKKYNKCHKEPLPDVMTPHTMRHTFCTRMANAGMNPKALQYIMGHANIVMTLNYYAHATFHSAQEEMERLQAKAKTTTEAKPEPAAESAEETKAA